MCYNSDFFREACGDPGFFSSSLETAAHALLWLLLEEGSKEEGVKALGLTTTKCLLVLFVP